jgi:type IV pilus assembly protein PilB
MASQLADLLLRRGRANEAQVARAAAEQKRTGELLGAALVRLGVLSEIELLECLQAEYGCGVADPAAAIIPTEVLELLPPAVARRHLLIPIARQGDSLTLAMCDPSNVAAINEVKFITGRDVRVAVATISSIARALRRHFAEPEEAEPVKTSSREIAVLTAGDAPVAEEGDAAAAPVVRLVHLLLARALQQGASDVHFEPFEQLFRIRYRVDGVLSEAMRPPWKLLHAVTARLKVMAGLDIAERRLPQDGRLRLQAGDGRRVDLRASVLPTIFGEKIVLRILDKGAVMLQLDGLGFDTAALRSLQAAAARSNGLILVTGPTGSGKTTTLYAILSELNGVGRNVCTVEDPVEYNLTGINQVQVHEDIGFTFAAALRALLRQDPDVIMVGEIRDRDTADIAVRAALTGHLVLSTLHTNDTASTVTRLLDIGVEPFLLSTSLRLVVAQRLLRRLCADCRQRDDVPAAALEVAGLPAAEAATVRCFRPVGCERCHGSGYRGRLAVYEVMPSSDALRALIAERAPADALAACARSEGVRSLRESALAHLHEGRTSLHEVLRCTE